jgi:hypothetical protein
MLLTASPTTKEMRENDVASQNEYAVQAPRAVVMMRPHHFTVNTETAADNSFQQVATDLGADEVRARAHAEVTVVAETLRSHGVRVHLFEDEGTSTPDSVFPNNWFTTHPGGHVAIHSMFAPSRRLERRGDVIELLKQEYRVQDVIDYSGLEYDTLFLEGTGALVFDHHERVAYVARSNRAHPVLLERFCTHFNYEPVVFDTAGPDGQPIYHTNVIMTIGTEFALVGFDLMTDADRATEIRTRLEETGRSIIALTASQIESFAGNTIELSGTSGRILALSETANDSLTSAQRAKIEESATLVPLGVPTIELAGGSVRCMIAGIHLSARPQ